MASGKRKGKEISLFKKTRSQQKKKKHSLLARGKKKKKAPAGKTGDDHGKKGSVLD